MLIIVFCPSTKPTGGVELLHQMVDLLRNKKNEAYIYYYNSPSAAVPDVYAKYNIETIQIVKDNSKQAIILPETSFHLAKDFTKSKVVLWWLSIDNYYHREKKHIPLYEIFSFSKIYGYKQLWHRIIRFVTFRGSLNSSFSIKKSIKANYIHAYQSQYAKEHLQARGVKNLIPLKDYIHTSFITTLEKTVGNRREKVVLYNPKKGIEFTRKLIKAAPDIRFIPLENLTREQLLQFFLTSMLYIDFGNHPGMDRLPREAALGGCCIITGTRGAANNDIDIPIDRKKYKFDETSRTTHEIISRIREILHSYDTLTTDFSDYRNRILNEEQEFDTQIDNLINYIKE
jgi:hypothetical protein